MPLANSYSADDVDDDDIMFLDEGGANAVTLLLSMVTMTTTANLVMVNNIILGGYRTRAARREVRVADLFNPPKRSRRPKLQHEPLLVRASSHPPYQ